MVAENKYRAWEPALNVALLSLTALLLRQVLSFYTGYIIFGLICASGFSFLLRDKDTKRSEYILNIVILTFLAWLTYLIFKSSFVYKDVVYILVRWILVLEILLTFGSAVPGVPAYIQMISIPLFMSHAIWVRHYNAGEILLVLGYIFCWFVLLKIKFFQFFESINIPGAKKDYSLWLSIIFLAGSVLLSWFIFSNILLTASPKIGLLSLEDSTAGKDDIESFDDYGDGLQKEYYLLQEKLVKEITELTPNFTPKENQQELLMELSLLIKEAPYVLEINKAESGLISKLRTPGLGIEPSEGKGPIAITKEYVDKKIEINLKMAQDSISRNLNSNDYGIKNRISILKLLKKMLGSNSARELNRNKSDISDTIERSKVSKAAKKELNEALSQIQDWKSLEIYRKHRNPSNEMSGLVDEETKSQIEDLSEDIDKAGNIDSLKNMGPEFTGDLHNLTSGGSDGRRSNLKDSLKTIEENYKSKEGILLSRENSGSAVGVLNDSLGAIKDVGSPMAEEPIEGSPSTFQSGNQDKLAPLSGADGSPKNTNEVLNIQVVPDHLEVSLGESAKFSALAKYSDNSESDITLLGDWMISNEGVVSMSAGNLNSISMGEAEIYVEYKGVKSLPAKVEVKEPGLLSVVISPTDMRLSMLAKAKITAYGYFTDDSSKDISSLVKWNIVDQRLAQIKGNYVIPKFFGETNVYAEYSGIKSLPLSIKVVVTIDWVFWVMAQVIFFAMLITAIVFLSLYFITLRKKKQLMLLLKREDKRDFIINIYKNARDILAIFGPSYSKFMGPRSYASLVEEKYSISDKLFLNFTLQFEEAQYSGHILQYVDAASSLGHYNDLLKILFNGRSKISALLIYLRSFIRSIPIISGTLPKECPGSGIIS